MHNDVIKLQNLIEEMQAVHAAFYDAVVPITEKIKKGEYSNADLADLGFLFREGENRLDDWRKDNKSRKELVGYILCKLLVEADQGDMVHGELCRAQIDLKMRPEMPKKGSQGWYDLHHHYGIDDPDNTPIRISWQGIEKECSKLIEQGKNVPPGMSNPKAQFSCKFTRSTRNVKN